MEGRDLLNRLAPMCYPNTNLQPQEEQMQFEEYDRIGWAEQTFSADAPIFQYYMPENEAENMPVAYPPAVLPRCVVPQGPLSPTNHDVKEPLSAIAPNSDKNVYPFEDFWRIKKDAHWDIVALSKRVGRTGTLPSPQARCRPLIWSETWHDAQDALPYFSVGQTILTSKVPRPQSRCVLLTKNLDNINVDWREGVIKFSMHIKYKLELTRPKNWQRPDVSPGYELKDIPKPPEPLQFRKLKACYDAGTPIKLLATGDLPSLPIVNSTIESNEGTEVQIDSNLWRKGVVVLGFFWVKKAEEVNPRTLSENNFDLETGKCSGEAHWDFEFKTCDKQHPSWWCPIGGDSESDFGDYNNPPTKKARRDDTEALLDHTMGVDEIDSGINAQTELPNNIQLHGGHDFGIPIDLSIASAKIDPPMSTNITNPLSSNSPKIPKRTDSPESLINKHSGPSEPAKAIEPTQPAERTNACKSPKPDSAYFQPTQIGLDLNPKDWPNIEAIRPPQIRSSMLLGWHCKTCGKLNPRVKWIETQICPLCKTVTKIAFPKWHRKAHTEAAGPIGTLYRLDDGGGHVHRTGLHAKASRDPENGMTIVKYWIADPYLPILAELGRIKPNARTRRGGLARPTPTPSQVGTSQPLSTASPMGGANTLPVISVHPKVQRDVAGSRAMLPVDTRVLFVHVTRPQHKHLLEVPDKIFSEFASTVPMERQINTKDYKTGKSSLSCHYTYLAGIGTSLLHTSTPAVGWDQVPDCVYNAQMRLTDMQCYNEGKNGEQDMFNQSVFVVGSGGNGVNSFRMIHRAEDGPVGYMVFGASCEVELMIGDGNGKRTTKAGAQRRTEVLMAHGDALFTAPPESDDSPIEVRVKRTGLAIIVVARYINDVPAPSPVAETSSAMEGVVYENSASGLKPPAAKARKRKSRG